jgi:octaprenyl-diphosphate synthase
MGDYVYSRAITLLVEAELTQVLALLATTVHRMSVGELMQLEIRDHPHFDEASYLQVIYEKTARLIESACRSGAILGGRPAAELDALGDFGRELGLSFQIIDDILDYVASPEVLGKPVGSDLAEGKQTLPLLKVHGRASSALRGRIETLLSAAPAGVEELIAIVRQEGGIEAALADARRYGQAARKALRRLPASEIRDALDATVDHVIERNF